MSRPTYLSGEQILDAHNAHGMGVSLDIIASKLGCTVQELRVAMGLPQWKSTPAADGCDLWRADELREVL
jgi:hypothetical protein